MNAVANTIAAAGAVALLVTGVIQAIRGLDASVFVLLSFGFLFAVLLLLAKFKHIKGFGFEAEMWEQTQEEAATVDFR